MLERKKRRVKRKGTKGRHGGMNRSNSCFARIP